MAEPARSRRSALKALGLSLAAAAGLWRFLTPRSAPPGLSADQGISVAEGEIPPDGALVFPQFRVAVVRDGTALLGLDLACTHLGCTVTATENGFACPCHGSRFTSTGGVLCGPAPRPLRRLEVIVENGIVRVTRNSEGHEASARCSRFELDVEAV